MAHIPFVKIVWENAPSTDTPVSATNLSNDEDRIALLDLLFAALGGTDATMPAAIGAVNTFLRSDGTNPGWRSAANVRSDLELVAGTNVQAWNAILDEFAALALGSALQVLRVNAGGTALEYATPDPVIHRTVVGPWSNSTVAGGTGTTSMSMALSGMNTEVAQFVTPHSGHVVAVTAAAYDLAAGDAITGGNIAFRVKQRSNPGDAWTTILTTGTIIGSGSQNAHFELFTPGPSNAFGQDKQLTIEIVATGVTLAGSDLDVMAWLEVEWD